MEITIFSNAIFPLILLGKRRRRLFFVVQGAIPEIRRRRDEERSLSGAQIKSHFFEWSSRNPRTTTTSSFPFYGTFWSFEKKLKYESQLLPQSYKKVLGLKNWPPRLDNIFLWERAIFWFFSFKKWTKNFRWGLIKQIPALFFFLFFSRVCVESILGVVNNSCLPVSKKKYFLFFLMTLSG